MGKYIEIRPMKNIKGLSINFRKCGLMFALLSKPHLRTITNKTGKQKCYFIAMHRLMLGIGFEIKGAE